MKMDNRPDRKGSGRSRRVSTAELMASFWSTTSPRGLAFWAWRSGSPRPRPTRSKASRCTWYVIPQQIILIVEPINQANLDWSGSAGRGQAGQGRTQPRGDARGGQGVGRGPRGAFLRSQCQVTGKCPPALCWNCRSHRRGPGVNTCCKDREGCRERDAGFELWGWLFTQLLLLIYFQNNAPQHAYTSQRLWYPYKPIFIFIFYFGMFQLWWCLSRAYFLLSMRFEESFLCTGIFISSDLA